MHTVKKADSLARLAAGQQGATLLLALIVLLLGSLLILPLLSFMGQGSKSGVIYQNKAKTQYAADSGIDDALWQIKYDHLGSTLTNPAYDAFDFATTWSYDLAEQPNDQTVTVAVTNVWVPTNVSPPDKVTARSVIDTGKLVVTGTALTTSTYSIKLSYYAAPGENLAVQSVGVWLPPGFSYTTGSSNLEADNTKPYYSVPVLAADAGNKAVVWSFSALSFSSLPGVNSQQTPMTATITFSYSANTPGYEPDAVAWTTTSGVSGITYSWDADVHVYKITAASSDTIIDSYFAKTEMRRIGAAQAGDYVAAGNSLMVDTNGDSHGVRDMLLSSSDATVNTIPPDAEVGAAFLYWSSWLNDSRKQTPLSDTGTSFNLWNNGLSWSVYNNYFRSHYASGGEAARYLTEKNSINLSADPSGTVTVSWSQWVSQLSALFSDTCSNFTNWTNGTAWSVYNNYFRANYSSGGTAARELTKTNSTDLSAYGNVSVSWDQWATQLTALLSDNCSNLNNWNYGSAWSENNHFRGRYSSGGEPAKYLTLKNSINLSAYASGVVAASWDQYVSGTPGPNDGLDFAFSGDGGTTWSSNIQAFRGNIGGSAQNFSYSIPAQYLTANFKMRCYLVGMSASGQYANIDNIVITPGYSANDGLDLAFSSDGGTTWSSNIQAFRGDIGSSPVNFTYAIPAQYLTATFKMKYYLVGMNAAGQYANVDNITITPAYSANDGLDFAFSDDGGVTWGSNIQAFRGDIGYTGVTFSYNIPAQYLTNNFKMRFYTVGMVNAGQYANIDNITILAMPPDTSASFKIDGTQVYFDANGVPQQGAQPLTASRLQVFANAPGIGGFSYSCYRDVTDLVKAFSPKAPDPALNHPGNATYTVGDVAGDTGTELSYAGWSLIIIYTTAQTQGHQLYLFDQFTYSSGNQDTDFDHDGQPGGYISGFIVPNPIAGETNAAKLTAFVGEGDDHYQGDFISINAPASYATHPQDIPDSYKLWDGTYSTKLPGTNTPGSPNNVWNGKSVGASADGVDIDTFEVPWASGQIQPGDTSARLDLYTVIDNWNLVYLILSFRSDSTTGGALNYLIR